MKPRIFIGSSSEALEIAYAIQENLDGYAEPTVWDQGFFRLTATTIDGLINALSTLDFAVFVFAPDDVAIVRDVKSHVARDNVVFELGLFIGGLGRDRTFFIFPRGHEDFRLPSDLAGMTAAMFDPSRQDGNLLAALGPACNKIRRAIQHLGHRTPAERPLQTSAGTSRVHAAAVRKDEVIQHLRDEIVEGQRLLNLAKEKRSFTYGEMRLRRWKENLVA